MGTAKVKRVRLTCTSSGHEGEEWLLERIKDEVQLWDGQGYEEVTFPAPAAPLRIKFETDSISITGGDGDELQFDAPPEKMELLRTFVDQSSSVQVKRVRLACITSGHEGQMWLLERSEDKVVLWDAEGYEEVTFPAVTAPLQIHFESGAISIAGDGRLLHFDAPPKKRAMLKAFIDDCAAVDPKAAVANVRGSATLDLVAAAICLVLAGVATWVSFLLVERGGPLVVAVGLYLGTFVEFVRGMSKHGRGSALARRLKNRAERAASLPPEDPTAAEPD